MRCPYCSKLFKAWKSVRAHISSCKLNSGQYFTDLIHGPIHYSKFVGVTSKEIRFMYPNLSTNTDKIKSIFSSRGIMTDVYFKKYSVKELLDSIKSFYTKYNRIPQARDFKEDQYPDPQTLINNFGSWNAAIKAAGFEPNENDGFGTRTIADDGVLYRSHYETLFVNKFLFNKEIYEYEIKYPGYNKFYDFYLPERNIYIEIDGGCRPAVMEEKIKINKELARDLLVIKGSEVATFQGF